MATRLYGVSRGDKFAAEVTEGVGSAVAADTVELTVDLAGNMSKLEVLEAIEAIKRRIHQSSWPPA